MVLIEEHGVESVRGLPGPLPPGERALWRGAPDWRLLAMRGFHLRWLIVYFAGLIAWHGVSAWQAGAGAGAIAAALVMPTVLAILGCGLVAGYAWLTARAAVYVLTDRRLVMRTGVALPITMNLPFTVIEGVALKRHRHGFGDVALQVAAPANVSWIVCWPHVRPFSLGRPQPMLRAIPDAERVAGVLVAALGTADGQVETPSGLEPAHG